MAFSLLLKGYPVTSRPFQSLKFFSRVIKAIVCLSTVTEGRIKNIFAKTTEEEITSLLCLVLSFFLTDKKNKASININNYGEDIVKTNFTLVIQNTNKKCNNS